MSRALYSRERPGIHCIRRWEPGTVWTGVENFAPIGIRFPDRPARSESLNGQVKEKSTNFLFIFGGVTAQLGARQHNFCSF